MSHSHVDSPGIDDFNDDSGFLSDQGKVFGSRMFPMGDFYDFIPLI